MGIAGGGIDFPFPFCESQKTCGRENRDFRGAVAGHLLSVLFLCSGIFGKGAGGAAAVGYCGMVSFACTDVACVHQILFCIDAYRCCYIS